MKPQKLKIETEQYTLHDHCVVHRKGKRNGQREPNLSIRKLLSSFEGMHTLREDFYFTYTMRLPRPFHNIFCLLIVRDGYLT